MTLTPARLRAGPDPDLRHLPVSLDLNGISLAEGVRAALSVAALVAINEWTGIPALAEAALGALMTCLCDPGGPIRRRVPPLLTFALLGPFVTASFALLRSAGVVPAAITGSAWIFGTMFARAWGPVPMQVGNLLTVVSILALDHDSDLREAAILGGMFAAGSTWALVLTLVIWRVHQFRPARRAIADVFRRLTNMTADLSTLLAGDVVRPDWAAHARAQRRYIRDAIEQARTVLFDTIRGRGQGGPRGNALVLQIEAADQIFGALIALSDLLEHGDADARDAARPILPALRLMFAATADAIGEVSTPVENQRAVFQRLLVEVARQTEATVVQGIVEAILQRIRVAALLTTPEADTVEGGLSADHVPLAARMFAPLRANLRWSSAALRHAIRAAVVAAPAFLLTLPTGVVYAHWLTITLILTLQPFFALTWQRALERVAGTVLGGIVAALLLAAVHKPIGLAALMFPLAVIAFAVRRVSFGLFMCAMTPLVVVLSELGRPDTSEINIALARAGFTVAGGAIAVLGGLLLWPSWEPARVRSELQKAIQTHGAYADAELAVLLGEAAAETADPARREAGVASNNLETSLSRALQEPTPSSRDGLQSAMLADAALRRIAGRLAALQYEPGLVGSADLHVWRTWLAAAFAALEAGEPLPGEPPKDEPGGSLARIARQISLIDGALRRAGMERPAAPSPQPPP
ncbi:MAG: FUSC family protein [Acetobacteraceae bacterium]|nr:FUSC family protein [Acetobacteraceae bacterium]